MSTRNRRKQSRFQKKRRKRKKMKIPSNLIVNFLYSEFQPKPTSTAELRINSPFEEDTKFHCYISPEKSVYTDFKGGSGTMTDRKSTRLNSSHQIISYAVFCLKKK